VEPEAQYRILPDGGLPRFFCNTAFEFDMPCITKKSCQRESVLRKKSRREESALDALWCIIGAWTNESNASRRESRKELIHRHFPDNSTWKPSGACAIASHASRRDAQIDFCSVPWNTASVPLSSIASWF
jgi:hypothetical protein